MFIILSYDVNSKRVKKVHSICKRFLIPKQKSLFEGNLTEGKLKILKNDLKKIIVSDYDSVNIYIIGNTKFCYQEKIGKQAQTNQIII